MSELECRQDGRSEVANNMEGYLRPLSEKSGRRKGGETSNGR